MFKPIETKKRYVQVIDQILEQMKKGILKTGDVLPPERLIAENLGISRPSVREAYSVLEMVGILESKVGSGTYVKSSNIDKFYKRKIKNISVTEESPYEILEVRKILEPEAAYLSAKNASKEDIAEIEMILKQMKSEMKDNASYTLETDSLFHLKIAEASGNAMIFNVMQHIINISKERLWEFIREKLIRTSGHIEKDMKAHQDILYSIKNKDFNAARSIMKKHLSQIQKEINHLT
ncbi:MAG: FadR family transcriptional regulator [Bacteroidetes bacterium]|nr:FadR family transcriptional regulator [Bacteroidota bacterium]